jgi:hypothetical protein
MLRSRGERRLEPLALFSVERHPGFGNNVLGRTA